MRKAEKEKAENMMRLLEQAHEKIIKAIESKKISDALNFLTDCQQGAISLGNLIEKKEGEGHALIPMLEEYCELVYQLYEGLINEDISRGISKEINKRYVQLQKFFRKIKSRMHEIKVKQEVVFLPYKASMWDSLESIWKAADEDPDCDAYVIPIPYFDKNPDGSFREAHYEGELYPEYVPVVWYEDYDFAGRQPDVVFIHNPYDEWNHVTSVHPFFYSSNLKQFTRKLIYIPYFILAETDPNDEEAVKGMEHFCMVPGVVYSDKVIVQSEKMRQVYIKVMTAFMSGQGYGKEYWEKKILGLGSPKIDKALHTKKEELEVPEAWLRIIHKPDGSWKKIIFYNTCVSALLKNDSQYLLKMKSVFRIFYKNRDRVALLWRPHPLIQATIESMRPELWVEYKEILEQYRNEGWGIYDDTADMNRAITLSDAYYGDGSSLVELCRKMGKPILIQNMQPEVAVSVVVPVLNTGKYVGECLESIRNQALKEIEVLCVDGGSTDGTLEVIEEYVEKDERFRLITDTKESYGAQVNRGIELAKGDYVAIAEPDDYVAEDMYQDLYQEAMQNDADIVRSNYCRFIGDGEERCFFPKSACKKEWYGYDLCAKRDKELFECSPANWSGIYRREFLTGKHIGHNTTKGAAYQDMGFWFLTFALAGKIRFMNKTGYYYRLDNPESSINTSDKMECLINEIAWLEEQLKRRQIYQDYSEKFHRVKEIHTAWMQRKAENIRYTELYKRIREKKQCILFGGGADGVDFLLLMKREGVLKYVSGITDNDDRLWGKKMLGIPVVPPMDTMQMEDILYIVTSSRYAMEIIKQLTIMGIKKENIQLWNSGEESRINES